MCLWCLYLYERTWGFECGKLAGRAGRERFLGMLLQRCGAGFVEVGGYHVVSGKDSSMGRLRSHGAWVVRVVELGESMGGGGWDHGGRDSHGNYGDDTDYCNTEGPYSDDVAAAAVATRA